jgi:hypothetical protein
MWILLWGCLMELLPAAAPAAAVASFRTTQTTSPLLQKHGQCHWATNMAIAFGPQNVK